MNQFFVTRAKVLAAGAAALGGQIDSVVKLHCNSPCMPVLQRLWA